MENEKAIELIDWLNNNWFIPTDDGNWKQDVENIEYVRTVPTGQDFWDAEELLQMFLNGDGES